MRPRVSREFSSSDRLGIYLQLYNLKVDSVSHKTKVSVGYRITQNLQEVWRDVEKADDFYQGGEELTIKRFVSLGTLAPGRYTVEITAVDLLTNQTVIRSADFSVTPVAARSKVPAL